MKRIAYVLGTFPVLSETFVGTEMRAMDGQGHAVVPIVMQRPREAGQDADRDLAGRAIHLDAIPASAGLGATLSAVGGLLSPRAVRGLSLVRRQSGLSRRSLLWNAARIAALAHRHGCTHLHAHFAEGAAAHALVAARLIGASVSFVAHGHDVYGFPCDLPVKLEAADFAVAVCADLAADLRTLAPRACVAMIPCGIDPERFQPRPDPEPDNGRLLFVGRLVGQKGVDDLVAALARLPAARRPGLDVVGRGPLDDALRAAVAGLGLGDTVRFLGSRPAGWIAAEGPRYRALVAPFRVGPNGERDTGPLVVKEAMAMGLPVISTRFMGVKETVTGETGRLVDPGDVPALAAAIAAVDALPEDRRREMGRQGRRRVVQHFTAAAQAGHLSALVEAA